MKKKNCCLFDLTFQSLVLSFVLFSTKFQILFFSNFQTIGLTTLLIFSLSLFIFTTAFKILWPIREKERENLKRMRFELI